MYFPDNIRWETGADAAEQAAAFKMRYLSIWLPLTHPEVHTLAYWVATIGAGDLLTSLRCITKPPVKSLCKPYRAWMAWQARFDATLNISNSFLHTRTQHVCSLSVQLQLLACNSPGFPGVFHGKLQPWPPSSTHPGEGILKTPLVRNRPVLFFKIICLPPLPVFPGMQVTTFECREKSHQVSCSHALVLVIGSVLLVLCGCSSWVLHGHPTPGDLVSGFDRKSHASNHHLLMCRGICPHLSSIPNLCVQEHRKGLHKAERGV